MTNWAGNLSAGDVNEGGQALNFIVTNDNGGLFAVQPAISSAGTLTYTLKPDALGTATVSVQIHDDGGTVNGGVDTSAVQSFTISVTFVNDVPSFTKGSDQTPLEDSGLNTVSNWATALSTGGSEESTQTLSFLLTNDNDGLFAVQPAVDSMGNLSYTLNPDTVGTAVVSVRIHDNGGTANGGVDTSDAQTFTIATTPVNDVPSFTKGADQTPLNGSGLNTVSQWATDISTGGSEEASQTVNFIVSNDKNNMFSVQPAIDSAGTLTYTLATDVFESATVTVRIHDNGGTANGGIDTSAPQTFVITNILPAMLPTFTKPGELISTPAGAQGGNPMAAAFSAGNVRYADGTVEVSAPGLASAGFGTPWGQDVAWTNNPLYTEGGVNGSGIVDAQMPHLLDVNADQSVLVLVSGGTNARYFDKLSDGSYRERYFLLDTLNHDAANPAYVFADPSGNQISFADFSAAVVPTEQGGLQSFKDAGNNVTSTYWSGGLLRSVTRTSTLGVTPVSEQYAYDYSNGLLQRVVLQRSVDNGTTWTTVRPGCVHLLHRQ